MPVVKVEAYQCNRCEYVWLPRGRVVDLSQKPVSCPKCGSPYWDRERVRPAPSKSGKSKTKKASGAP